MAPTAFKSAPTWFLVQRLTALTPHRVTTPRNSRHLEEETCKPAVTALSAARPCAAKPFENRSNSASGERSGRVRKDDSGGGDATGSERSPSQAIERTTHSPLPICHGRGPGSTDILDSADDDPRGKRLREPARSPPGWLEFSPAARPRIGCVHSERVGGRVTLARPNFIARSCRSDDKLHDHDLWQQFQGRPA